MRNFKSLAIFCGCAARFVSDQVRNQNVGFHMTWLKILDFHGMFAGGVWYGVDVLNEDIADNFEAFVWEPAIVKINALTAASEATCLILSVDETIRNPKSQGEGGGGGGMGRGRGRPM